MDGVNEALLRAHASHVQFLAAADAFSGATHSVLDVGHQVLLAAGDADPAVAPVVGSEYHGAAPAAAASAASSVPVIDQWTDCSDTSAASSSAPVSSSSKRELRSPERPPAWKRPRREVSQAELNELRAEAAVAKEMKLKWQERGPPGAPGEKWRGQNYRANTGKWANRGGGQKVWYNAYYAAKQAGPEAQKAFLELNQHPKGDKASSSGDK